MIPIQAVHDVFVAFMPNENFSPNDIGICSSPFSVGKYSAK